MKSRGISTELLMRCSEPIKAKCTACSDVMVSEIGTGKVVSCKCGESFLDRWFPDMHNRLRLGGKAKLLNPPLPPEGCTCGTLWASNDYEHVKADYPFTQANPTQDEEINRILDQWLDDAISRGSEAES